MKKLLAAVIPCVAAVCVLSSCSDSKESTVSLVPVSEEAKEEYTEEIPVTETETEPETKSYIEGDASAFIGKWECAEFLQDGEPVEDMGGVPTYALFQYEIKEDGTAVLPPSLIEAQEEYGSVSTYVWGLISENEIQLVSSGGIVIDFTLQDDGRIMSDEDNEKIYLVKTDEFTDFDFLSFYKQIEESMQTQIVMTPIETDASGNVVSSGEPILIEPSSEQQ